VETVCFIVFV